MDYFIGLQQNKILEKRRGGGWEEQLTFLVMFSFLFFSLVLLWFLGIHHVGI